MSHVIEFSDSEAFAVNQWLADCPCDWTYQEIIDYLKNNNRKGFTCFDDGIAVWELIEDCSGPVIAQIIEDTREAFERATRGK